MQTYIILGMLAAFAALGIGMYFSIKKHNAKMAAVKKKKGRRKYMPEYKSPAAKR